MLCVHVAATDCATTGPHQLLPCRLVLGWGLGSRTALLNDAEGTIMEVDPQSIGCGFDFVGDVVLVCCHPCEHAFSSTRVIGDGNGASPGVPPNPS